MLGFEGNTGGGQLSDTQQCSSPETAEVGRAAGGRWKGSRPAEQDAPQRGADGRKQREEGLGLRFVHLGCTSEAPGELLKHPVPKPPSKPMKSRSLGPGASRRGCFKAPEVTAVCCQVSEPLV